MAASDIQNPPAPVESKSAKKKKAKLERTESPAPVASSTASVAGGEEKNDEFNPYIRELQKSVHPARFNSS